MYELTRNQLLTIESFMDEYSSNDNLVSKKQVTELEDAIGLQIVTEHVDIKRLTDLPTVSNYFHIKDIMSDVIKNVKVTDLITENDYVLLAKDFTESIERIIRKLKRLQNIPNSKIDSLLDTKLTGYYFNDELKDVSLDPIFDVFKYHTDYLSRTFSNDELAHAMNKYTELALGTTTSIDSLPVLLGTMLDYKNLRNNILLGNMYCKKTFTILDMVDVIKNVNSIISVLEGMPKVINGILIESKYSISITKTPTTDSEPFSYQVLLENEGEYMIEKTSYNTMKNVVECLNDPESICLIKMFKNLAVTDN